MSSGSPASGGSLRVEIDKQICQSAGNCVAEAPEAFGFDDDDLGDVLPTAGALSRERLIAVARRCPAIAITLFEPDGSAIDVAR